MSTNNIEITFIIHGDIDIDNHNNRYTILTELPITYSKLNNLIPFEGRL